MRRTCDHPGCVGAASISFAFDGERRVVRIHLPNAPGAAGLLCSRHATRFQPPHGWEVIDGRPAAPAERLAFDLPAPAAPADPTTPPTPVAAVAETTERAEAPAVSESDESAEIDEFDDLLNADSPLLARAFRTAL